MKPQLQGQIKTCCADFYAKPLVSWLLGDSFHPGGLELTQRLGRMLDLTPSDRVLDIATGTGTSGIFVAKEFGCAVVGVDISVPSISRARAAASRENLEAVLNFTLGDADSLPFSDGCFDVVWSECAISTFPDKRTSAREMARVLKPNGRLGFTDVVLAGGGVSEALPRWLFQAGCIADACSAVEYQEIFASAGFSGWREEAHPEGLIELLRQVRLRLLGLEVGGGLQKVDLSGLDLTAAKKVLERVEDWVQSGAVSYFAFSAVKEA